MIKVCIRIIPLIIRIIIENQVKNARILCIVSVRLANQANHLCLFKIKIAQAVSAERFSLVLNFIIQRQEGRRLYTFR